MFRAAQHMHIQCSRGVYTALSKAVTPVAVQDTPLAEAAGPSTSSHGAWRQTRQDEEDKTTRVSLACQDTVVAVELRCFINTLTIVAQHARFLHLCGTGFLHTGCIRYVDRVPPRIEYRLG